jgi:hypothetical protein
MSIRVCRLICIDSSLTISVIFIAKTSFFAVQEHCSPSQGNKNEQYGPYGRIVTPAARVPCSPTLSPIGAILRARRLVLQVPKLAKPDAPEAVLDMSRSDRTSARLSACIAQQSQHKIPRLTKNVESAPCVAMHTSPVRTVAKDTAKLPGRYIGAHDRECTGKHNGMYRRDPTPCKLVARAAERTARSALKLCSVHLPSEPTRAATHSCIRAATGGFGLGTCAQEEQLTASHWLAESAKAAVLQPTHWDSEGKSGGKGKQHAIRMPAQRCSAPVPTMHAPEHYLRKRLRFSEESAPLHSTRDSALEVKSPVVIMISLPFACIMSTVQCIQRQRTADTAYIFVDSYQQHNNSCDTLGSDPLVWNKA